MLVTPKPLCSMLASTSLLALCSALPILLLPLVLTAVMFCVKSILEDIFITLSILLTRVVKYLLQNEDHKIIVTSSVLANNWIPQHENPQQSWFTIWYYLRRVIPDILPQFLPSSKIYVYPLWKGWKQVSGPKAQLFCACLVLSRFELSKTFWGGRHWTWTNSRFRPLPSFRLFCNSSYVRPNAICTVHYFRMSCSAI